MALAVEGFRPEAQFIAGMHLVEDLLEAGGVVLRSDREVLAARLGGEVVGDGALFAHERMDVGRPGVAEAEANGRGAQEFVDKKIGLGARHGTVVAIKEDQNGDGVVG